MLNCDHRKQESPPNKKQPAYEIADIFNLYFDEYLEKHPVNQWRRKIIQAIRECRTAALGAHLRECAHCGYEEPAYNSCRNRHCPKCQGRQKEDWVKARLSELLPIGYFHSVFTLTDLLHPVMLGNQIVMYNIFFQSAAETLHTFAADPRYLGGKIGFIGILHTWGQQMPYHPHLHFIVTGGGISEDGKHWLEARGGKKFLFPDKAMSLVMRGKFLEKTAKAYEKGELVFKGRIAHLAEPGAFKNLLKKVARTDFVIRSQAPFAEAKEVVAAVSEYSQQGAIENNRLLEIGLAGTEETTGEKETLSPDGIVHYMAEYAQRVGMTNKRLVSIEEGQIQFRFKNNRQGGKEEVATFSAEAFIRRFLLHILPKGFHKIRHYGLLSGSQKKRNLARARKLLSHLKPMQLVERALGKWEEKANRCPQCRLGKMSYQGSVSTELVKLHQLLTRGRAQFDTS